MATTSKTPPANANSVSEQKSATPTPLEDANSVGGLGAKDLGEGEKWQLFQKFTGELSPIVDDLNGLMAKYGICLDGFILLQIQKNKIVPFLNYTSFSPLLSGAHSIEA